MEVCTHGEKELNKVTDTALHKTLIETKSISISRQVSQCTLAEA